MERFALKYLTEWHGEDGRKPLILRGSRQVGKSTLVREFAKNMNLDLFEINLERHAHLDQVFKSLNLEAIERQLEAVVKQSLQNKGSQLLFLDEIQATPHALAALRYFYEDRPNLAVIAAGSLLDFTLAHHEFSMPVGRIEYLHIEPMSFGEYLIAADESWLQEQLCSFQLGDTWPDASHRNLCRRLHEYMTVGGMPEVISRYLANNASPRWRKTQDNIIQTYRDDFNKYAKLRQIPLLQQTYTRLPQFIGKKIKYSELAANERAENVRKAFDLISMARITRKAFYTHADGIPIAAQIEDKIFKPYWLDVGLLNAMLGSKVNPSDDSAYQFHDGVLAEQFIAQHLSSFHVPTMESSLFYWLREGKANNAEIDFIVQWNKTVIPIEVKSKKSGALKSLLQIMGLRKFPLAVKFSLENPSLVPVSHTATINETQEQVSYDLMTLPLYFVEQLPRLVAQWEKASLSPHRA